jgi:hypothetical protein
VKRRYLAIALFAASICGCGTGQPPAEQVSPDAYAAAVKTENSQFEKSINYQGSRIRLKRDCLFGLANQDRDTCNETDSYLIRGWKDRSTGYLNNQLYVDVYYMGPLRSYEMASFQGGEQGQFTRIDLKLIGCYQTNGKCDYTEDFGVGLSTQFLQDHVQSGFAVQASAKDGTKTVFIVPPSYVQGYLNAVR